MPTVLEVSNSEIKSMMEMAETLTLQQTFMWSQQHSTPYRLQNTGADVYDMQLTTINAPNGLWIIIDINTPMKIILFFIAMLFTMTYQATCTHDLEVLCIDDINKAYPICDQAAKQKGKDVPVDLECLKYIGTIDKDCWPCICAVAKAQHWNVKGCN